LVFGDLEKVVYFPENGEVRLA
jgi:hypothetical protein